MAEYFEHVQRKVRPASAVDEPLIGPPLTAGESDFARRQVRRAARELQHNRAAGGDHIPAEYWNMPVEDDERLPIATRFTNRRRRRRETPKGRHKAVT
eukprot:7769698-Pyramimonas_sp.AAC.1